MNRQCDCIDYPVSWSYWRDHCRVYHNYDPGENEPPRSVYPEEDNPYILHEAASPRDERKGMPDLYKEVAILKGEMVWLKAQQIQRPIKKQKKDRL